MSATVGETSLRIAFWNWDGAVAQHALGEAAPKSEVTQTVRMRQMGQSLRERIGNEKASYERDM